MPDIEIDTSSLTFKFFAIPQGTGGFLDGSTSPPPTVSLPARKGYTFTQGGLAPASFQFDVTEAGTIDFSHDFDGFLAGRGERRLTVRGLPVQVDGTALDHGLLPQVVKASFLGPDQVHPLSLVPSRAYRLAVGSGGIVGSMDFGLAANGDITVAAAASGFASASGSKLTVRGRTIKVNGQALSHDLLPVGLAGYTGGFLPRAGTNPLTLLPGVGYRFQPGGGVVGALTYGVNADGTVAVGSEFSSYATASGDTLTVTGHTIRIDGQKLSHDLLPVGLGGYIAGFLPRRQVNPLTLLPAVGYRFQPGGGVVGTLTYGVNADGTVSVGQEFSSYATASGDTLTITGHTIKIDGRTLSHDLLPISLGGYTGGFLPRSQVNPLTLLPAMGYRLQPGGGVVADMSYDVGTDGDVSFPESCQGFLAGAGTDTLVVGGYAIVVDASHADSDLLSIVNLGLRPQKPRELSATLVPAAGYRPQTRNGVFTSGFNIERDGSITFDPAVAGSYVVRTSSSPNPSAPGEEVTIQARVRAVAPGSGLPQGSLTFSEAGVVLGNATLDGSGQATFRISTLGSGDHDIVVEYEGDERFERSQAQVRHRVE